ncbi:MAG TPA: sporulation protein YqfD, partial [Clostridiales bacterium]|nr:sporulation protein YqfD [Clostridiales bacterium]
KAHRPNGLTLRMTISAPSFFQLPGLVRGLGLSVKIVKKQGPLRPFLPIVKRPGLWAGGLCFWIALYIFSSFVWAIRIYPNGADDRLLLSHLSSFGLNPGASIRSLDEGQIKEQVLLAMKDLAWVGIYVKGSTVEIKYELLEKAPEIVPVDEPASIYADKTGILTRIDAFKGTAMAKVGDTVEPGDLLVSAKMEAGEKHLLAHSLARIEARVWYDLVGVSAASGMGKEYTGAKTEYFYILAGRNKIKFMPAPRISYANYDKLIQTVDFPYAGLPLILVRETYLEYEAKPVVFSAESEEARIAAVIEKTLKESMKNGTISASAWTGDSGPDGVRVLYQAETKEEIGETRPYAGEE